MASEETRGREEAQLVVEVLDSSITQPACKKGGWSTVPFIIGSALASTVAIYGVTTDLMQLLDRRFNIESIKASQITNIINSLMNLTPVAGALLCDSYLGCFLTISVFTFISFLACTFVGNSTQSTSSRWEAGMQEMGLVDSWLPTTFFTCVVPTHCGWALPAASAGRPVVVEESTTCRGTVMITLASAIPSLAPLSCDHALGSCSPPSTTQFALLCIAFAVTTLGAAGTSFTFVTVGANQFDESKDQEVFVNCFFFTTTLAMLVSFTVVVYVLDNVGWGWGYGACAVLNAISFALFVQGKRRYRDVRPTGSPLGSLVRVVVSAARKAKAELSENEGDYYRGAGAQPHAKPLLQTSSFRFFNKAALVTKGDTYLDGSIAKPWRLCTIEEVEDLKALLKLLPLWSTGIFLATATGIQTNLNILQSLTMDRSLGPHFKIPAASFQVFVLISMALFLPIIDRSFYPVCRIFTRRSPTILHRIGAGHIVNVVGLIALAYVESRRLKMMHSHVLENRPDLHPMSALWLVPPLAVIGAGSAFCIPGQVSLYYQEFPASLKNTGTSMMSLTMGIGFYLSTLVVDVLGRVTRWLNTDINKGRLDNVFWMLAVLGGLNFLYYITCAKLYKLKSIS